MISRLCLAVFCGALGIATAAPARAQTASSSQVQWANNALTVAATDVPFQALIEQVASRTGLLIVGTERLTGVRSVEFRDKPLREALTLLLDGVNFVLAEDRGVLRVSIHSLAADAPRPVTRKGPIIIPGLSDTNPGQTNTTMVDPGLETPEDDEEQEELAKLEGALQAKGQRAMAAVMGALHSEYPAVRVRALTRLGDVDKAISLPLISSALADEDTDVSLTASTLIAEIPGKAALDATVAQLIPTADVDTQFAALRALALRADLGSIPHVQKATHDVDPILLGFAASLLQELQERKRATAAATPK